jgi:hypothetical protein
VVVGGPPERIAKTPESYTGQFLVPLLSRSLSATIFLHALSPNPSGADRPTGRDCRALTPLFWTHVEPSRRRRDARYDSWNLTGEGVPSVSSRPGSTHNADSARHLLPARWNPTTPY